MHIRPARLEDSPQLARIQVDSYQTAYAGIMPQPYLDRFSVAEQTRDWQALLAGDWEDLLLVAEVGEGELAGYALGRVLPPLPDPTSLDQAGAAGDGGPDPFSTGGFEGELVGLHVRRARQGQGIGRALIAAMATALRGAGCRSLILWTLAANPARGLYERLGGRPAGEKAVEIDGVQIAEVAYAWPSIEALELERLGQHRQS